MREALFPLFQFAEGTAAADFLRSSIWAFPVIQAVHLLGLCMLGGAVLIVDLRLFGVGLKHQRIDDVIRDARRWMIMGVLLMIVTGILMFLPAAAVRYFINTSFWVKMTTLPIALLFTFGSRELLLRYGRTETSKWTRLVGAASIGLWFTVTAAGRWIGFS